MGPLATADFMGKVIALTPAERDQDHVPLIVHSVPQVPDRSASILEGTESPLPAMLQGLRRLLDTGAECIAVPCNSAHYWYDDLAGESTVPVLHIVDAVGGALARRGVGDGPVGLLATAGAVFGGIYQARLGKHGYECVVPEDRDQEDLVTHGIGLVKAGRLEDARAPLEAAADKLRQQGVRMVVLGCTEIPLVLNDGNNYLDSTEALAERCVEWYSDRVRRPE
jgi:aspartate racemase